MGSKTVGEGLERRKIETKPYVVKGAGAKRAGFFVDPDLVGAREKVWDFQERAALHS